MDQSLIRKIKKSSDLMDKKIGIKAIYRTEVYGTPDVESGAEAKQIQNTNVVVRPNPLSVTELSRLSQAGIRHVTSRWTMQTKYRSDVKSGDLLIISGFQNEILSDPSAEKDELEIEWTVYTRRR